MALAAIVAGALPTLAFADPADPFAPDNPFFAAGLDRQEREQDDRDSDEAKAERQASRTRFIGLSASESRALGRRAFPEAFSAETFDGEHPAPGLKIVDFRAAGVGVAETSQGERLLVSSTAPLRAQAPNGEMAPVDLSLRESAETFSTANSNADVRVAKDVAEGIELPGAGVTVAVDTDEEVTGTQTDGRVVYSDVATDTDHLVVPQPDGAELSWLLRSPQAPERFVLDLDIPEGAEVRRAQSKDPIPADPPRSLEIIDGETVLGYIEAPVAYDADGAPVKSDLIVLDEDRVVMTVEHRGRDLRFPLYADPEVVLPNDYPRGWLGWRNWYSHGSNWNATTNRYGFALFDPAYNGSGVYLSMPTNTYFAPQGTGTNWGYTAPDDTYIYRSILGSIGHNPLPTWYSYGYLFSHIYSGMLNGNWEAGQSWVSNYGTSGPGIFGPFGYSTAHLQLDHCFEARCSRSTRGEQNQAVFGLSAINNYNSANIYTGSERAQATMGYASVYLGDGYSPTFRSAPPASTAWQDDSANRTHDPGLIAVSDRGLGLTGATLSGAATGNGTLRQYACTGDPHRSACPKTLDTAGFRYTLNEGTTTLTMQARDAVDNVANQTWTKKIDRSDPRMTLSGTLAGQDGVIAGDRAYALNVNATDGVLGGTASQLRSGVASIHIKVNGISQGQPTLQTDSRDSAPLTRSYSFAADQLAEGEYTIEVVVLDRTGNDAKESFRVLVDGSREAPLVHDFDETDDPDADNPADYSTDTSDICLPIVQLLNDCAQPENDAAMTRAAATDPAAQGATSAPIGRYQRPTVNCSSAPPPGKWGISDQKSSVWGVPRLVDLKPTRARRTVGWDAVSKGEAAASGTEAFEDLAAIDRWMTAVLQRCFEPLVPHFSIVISPPTPRPARRLGSRPLRVRARGRVGACRRPARGGSARPVRG